MFLRRFEGRDAHAVSDLDITTLRVSNAQG